MLLQLEEVNADDMSRLLAFAKHSNIKLSAIDEDQSNHLLPGRPLTDEQITWLINKSRSGNIISVKNAHQMIRKAYEAD